MTRRGRPPGIFVSQRQLHTQTVKDLLVEAAYLCDQPSETARAWAWIAAGLALLRMAEADPDGVVQAQMERILSERKAAA